MVTIKHNRPTSLDVLYTGGKRNFLQLLPGVNLNVDDIEWTAAKRHPSVRFALESGILDELSKTPTTADLDGLQVTLKDDPLSGQPMPVQDVKHDLMPTVQVKRWKPDQSELIALEHVGKAAAGRIVNTMPEDGFSSFEEFKNLNPGIKVSDSEVEAKFS